MAQRYDHANVIVTRERVQKSLAGTTAVMVFNFWQKCRVTAVHLYPTIVGTSDTGKQTVKSIIATTTASVGIGTIGTAAIHAKASAVTIAIGTGNTPAGITLDANEALTITNETDGTIVYNALIEYEVLPDAVRT